MHRVFHLRADLSRLILEVLAGAGYKLRNACPRHRGGGRALAGETVALHLQRAAKCSLQNSTADRSMAIERST